MPKRFVHFFLTQSKEPSLINSVNFLPVPAKFAYRIFLRRLPMRYVSSFLGASSELSPRCNHHSASNLTERLCFHLPLFLGGNAPKVLVLTSHHLMTISFPLKDLVLNAISFTDLLLTSHHLMTIYFWIMLVDVFSSSSLLFGVSKFAHFLCIFLI